MTTLVRVEMRRLVARRITRFLLVLAVAGFAIAGTIVFFQSNDSPSAFEAARHDVEQEVQGCIDFIESENQPIPSEFEDAEAFCRAQLVPQVDDPRWHLSELHGVFQGMSPIFAILAWILGASFIGAEWQKGTITTLLTWEPRRIRLLVAKLMGCAVVVFLGTQLLFVLLGAALTPAAIFRGVTTGLDTEWWRELTGIALRVGLLTSIAAALGFSIASIGRNTAAAFGLGFGYMVIVENLIRGLKPHWSNWLLGDNAATLVLGGGGDEAIIGRSTIEAGLLLALYASVLLIGAGVIFKRRDVSV